MPNVLESMVSMRFYTNVDMENREREKNIFAFVHSRLMNDIFIIKHRVAKEHTDLLVYILCSVWDFIKEWKTKQQQRLTISVRFKEKLSEQTLKKSMPSW